MTAARTILDSRADQNEIDRALVAVITGHASEPRYAGYAIARNRLQDLIVRGLVSVGHYGSEISLIPAGEAFDIFADIEADGELADHVAAVSARVG